MMSTPVMPRNFPVNAILAASGDEGGPTDHTSKWSHGQDLLEIVSGGGGSGPLMRRRAMDQAFESALCGLAMAYQPIVDLQARTVLAHEALMRPNGFRFRDAGAMLRAAERLHRYGDLGRKVRTLVATGIADSAADVFVNLHPMELWDDAILDDNCPLRPFASRVVFEITEHAPVGRDGAVKTRIAMLRRAGYRIALDDFGVGFADYGTLAVVAPDIVKVDRSLVRACPNSTTARQQVAKLLAYCQAHGATLIGEGVECYEELIALRTLGLRYAQGYMFARPAPQLAAHADIAFPNCTVPTPMVEE